MFAAFAWTPVGLKLFFVARNEATDLELWAVDSSAHLPRVSFTTAGQSADEALTILAGALDIRVTRHGRQVRLSANPRPTASR